jgi:hypothetical protein
MFSKQCVIIRELLLIPSAMTTEIKARKRCPRTLFSHLFASMAAFGMPSQLLTLSLQSTQEKTLGMIERS